jgi:hypothetical protein
MPVTRVWKTTSSARRCSVAKVEGQTVKVGDYVSFKCDIEQGGVIYKIEGDRLFLQAGSDGFEGGYIGGQDTTVQIASDCWLD